MVNEPSVFEPLMFYCNFSSKEEFATTADNPNSCDRQYVTYIKI